MKKSERKTYNLRKSPSQNKKGGHNLRSIGFREKINDVSALPQDTYKIFNFSCVDLDVPGNSLVINITNRERLPNYDNKQLSQV
jgi:hypothetical protein